MNTKEDGGSTDTKTKEPNVETAAPKANAESNSEDVSGKSNEKEEKDGKDEEPAVAVYRDYSRDRPEKPASSRPTAKDAAHTFPMKLHAILSNPEFQDIISWLPHGRAWRILQHRAFEERVIPLYFRHGRYSSFARQVNGWGFRRITHGPDYNSYYHEMFLRGLPHLCDKMKRLTSKDIKSVNKDNAPLPDFYALSRDFPLPEPQVGAPSSAQSGVPSVIANSAQPGFGPQTSFNGTTINGLAGMVGGAPGMLPLAGIPAPGTLDSSNAASLENRRADILQRLGTLLGPGSPSNAAAPGQQGAIGADSILLSQLLAQGIGMNTGAPNPAATTFAGAAAANPFAALLGTPNAPAMAGTPAFNFANFIGPGSLAAGAPTGDAAPNNTLANGIPAPAPAASTPGLGFAGLLGQGGLGAAPMGLQPNVPAAPGVPAQGLNLESLLGQGGLPSGAVGQQLSQNSGAPFNLANLIGQNGLGTASAPQDTSETINNGQATTAASSLPSINGSAPAGSYSGVPANLASLLSQTDQAQASGASNGAPIASAAPTAAGPMGSVLASLLGQNGTLNAPNAGAPGGLDLAQLLSGAKQSSPAADSNTAAVLQLQRQLMGGAPAFSPVGAAPPNAATGSAASPGAPTNATLQQQLLSSQLMANPDLAAALGLQGAAPGTGQNDSSSAPAAV